MAKVASAPQREKTVSSWLTGIAVRIMMAVLVNDDCLISYPCPGPAITLRNLPSNRTF
jgi:hypothetical protein